MTLKTLFRIRVLVLTATCLASFYIGKASADEKPACNVNITATGADNAPMLKGETTLDILKDGTSVFSTTQRQINLKDKLEAGRYTAIFTHDGNKRERSFDCNDKANTIAINVE